VPSPLILRHIRRPFGVPDVRPIPITADPGDIVKLVIVLRLRLEVVPRAQRVVSAVIPEIGKRPIIVRIHAPPRRVEVHPVVGMIIVSEIVSERMVKLVPGILE
jgi:hypothetical protein